MKTLILLFLLTIIITSLFLYIGGLKNVFQLLKIKIKSELKILDEEKLITTILKINENN